MKQIIIKLVIALALGAAASVLSGFGATPARLIVFLGVAAVAFFLLPFPKKD